MKNHFKNFLKKPTKSKVFLCVLLFGVLCSFTAQAQKKTVKGIVKDEIGMPLPGVNVLELGTKNGAITDFDGNYSINVKEGATLEFSYVGYKTLDVAVSGAELNVELQPDIQQLEETIVIGYGTAKKKDLTGSVASVKMDKLTEAPVVSFDQALGGRVAGVQVSSDSGEPGAAASISIRGNNSVNGSNEPLYVVDGFIIPNFDPGLIDQSDIESINVLKDASATAIYGVNGSNGVIIITTKKAKAGKTKVTYETRLDVSQVAKQLELLDTYEYIKLGLEINESSTISRFFSVFDEAAGQSVTVGDLEDYRNVPSRNWQDEAFRTSFSESHKLRISGGGDETRYNASLNIVENMGTLIRSDYNRTNGRLTLNHKINDKADTTVDVIYTNSVQNGINVNGNASYSFLRSLITYAPVANIYRDFGDFDPLNDVSDEFDFTNIVVWHPIVSLNNEYRRLESDQFISNVRLRYKLLDGLTFDTRGSFNTRFRKTGVFNNSKTVYGRLISKVNGINGTVDRRREKNFASVNTLTYRKRFGNHSINAVLGATYNLWKSERTSFTSIEIPKYLEHLGINAIDGGELLDANDINSTTERKLFSFLGRVNYSFKNKYLFTGTIRRDASSNFQKNNRIGTFPSVALSWKAEQEPFIKKLNVFSQLKFRVGYGETGNDRIPQQASIPGLLTDQDTYYTGLPAVRPQDLAGNPDVKWETTEQTNLGVDMGLFNGRVAITAEVYQKDTKDLLLLADQGPSIGTLFKWRNVGQIRNRGFELSINTTNVKTKNFSWVSDFNISFNQNKVVALAEGKPLFSIPNYYQRLRTQQFVAEEGKALGNMFGYVSDGVYQPEDFENYDSNASSHTLAVGEPSYKASHQPGDEKYKDLDGDGRITAKDRTIIGNGLPKHFGGFGNTFTYKNFELSAFLQWSYGNDILNANRLVFENVDNPAANQLATVVNRWTPENQNTTMHRARGRGFEDISSRIVEDGSFIRLKTVNLAYNFSRDVVEKLNINSLELYLSAQNLITWTKYSGFDPEVSVRRTALTPGIDYSAYPRSKTVSLGLTVSF